MKTAFLKASKKFFNCIVSIEIKITFIIWCVFVEIMGRKIYFKTSNQYKVSEVQKLFSRYGVEIITQNNAKVFAKIKEHTTLVGKYGPLKHVQLEPVIHTSTLGYTICETGIFGTIEFSVYGYLDLTKKKDETFGFDSIFTVYNLHKTYSELSEDGLKISARDHVISMFIQKFLYRTMLGDWTFNPQKFSNPLELHRDPALLFQANPYINTEIAKQYGIYNMITHVLNSGIFFRASKNRRQNLYWFPGLNAGVPFVSKPKDPIHELVFFIHDIVHQAIPDLIYTGETDSVSRFIYIVYRLMSEAITLISADVFFVNSIIRSGFVYNTINDRKIYPVFEGMDISKLFFELLYANMIFCMFGDLSEFQKYHPDPESLKDYSSKYEKFFIQDFEWTRHNFDDMMNRSGCFTKWWNFVKGWSPEFSHSGGDEMITISQFREPELVALIEAKSYRQACDVIFERIMDLYIKPAFTQEHTLLDFSVRYDRTFRRYFMGQAMIFFRYPNDPILSVLNTRMLDPRPITIEDGTAIRNFYSDYIAKLRDISLLTEDDYATFIEIYPLFEPMIVSYDSEFNTNVPFVERIR